ncbi:MAG TPA: Mur ligase family protein, partial [Chitinophagales bacterium]|nr:Mur ligase family protein [Chitinophagales bacterium]
PIIAEIQPSFFEITVAMAFYYFAKQKVDIAIIETGLGGRLDSTNIIQPLLSIITNISYDHQSILGNTLAEITNEKAGIIKCKTPAIIGRNQPEIRNVFEAKAKNENAPLFFADELIQVDNYTLKDGLLNIDFVLRNTKEKEMICTDLNAVYQIENMKTVFAAMLVYNQFYEAIPMSKIKAGLLNVQQQTNFGGRWQVISTEPKIVVDVGHNEDGIVKIIEQLKLEKYEHLHLIYSAVKDKDVDKIIRLLPANATYYLTEAKLERKMPVEILQEKFNGYNLQNKGYKNATLALQAAKQNASKLDLILVVGSFFILEDILQY